jgi:3-deoxy-manno-octulosonate cytidylyltransferase (CMP-KDO synthetase)
VDAWNATGPIEHADELDRHSFVKCSVAVDGRILHCFRRSPFYSAAEVQSDFVRKILGIVVYRREFLSELTVLPPTPIEQAEFIEQMRIIESGHTLRSVPVSPSLPSVNEPEEADLVLDYVQRTPEQLTLLAALLQGL